MSFLRVQILVTSPLRILLQHTTLYLPYLLHLPFIITRFGSLLNYHSHISPCTILLYQSFQSHQMRLLGYLLIPSCIPLDLNCNHGLVVLLSTTCWRHTLCIIIMHLISIPYLLPTSLPFQISFITCIAFIIVVLADLLLPLVLNLVRSSLSFISGHQSCHYCADLDALHFDECVYLSSNPSAHRFQRQNMKRHTNTFPAHGTM